MYTSSLFILLVSMVSVMAVPTPSDDPPPDPNASVLPYLLAPGVSLVAPDLIDVQSLDKGANDQWGGNATSWRFAFKDDYKSEHFSVSVLKEDDPTKVVQKLEVRQAVIDVVMSDCSVRSTFPRLRRTPLGMRMLWFSRGRALGSLAVPKISRRSVKRCRSRIYFESFAYEP